MSTPEVSSEKHAPLRDEHGRLLPNQPSLNPLGRPKGSFSIKTRIVQRLQENPQELKDVIDYLITKERALLFQMIDGRPHQSGDVEVKLPQNLIDLIRHGTPDKETDEDIPTTH
jgi:hypothetical protein